MKKYHLIAVVLLAVFALQGLWAVLALSPTFDEPIHLAAGYCGWMKGDFSVGYDHPPLGELICSAPMLFARPYLPDKETGWTGGTKYDFGFNYLFRNRLSPEVICNSGRFMMLLLGLALGAALYASTLSMWGVGAALLALFLYVFCPPLMANAALVTTDFPLAAFYFLSFITTLKLLRGYSAARALTAGLFTGLALATKFSAVMAAPALGVVFCAELFRNRRSLVWKRTLAGGGLFSVAAVFAVLLPYGFVHAKYFVLGLEEVFTKVSTGSGFDFFLAGEYSAQGWYRYFITAFLLKTPLPLVIFSGTGLAFAVSAVRKSRNEKTLFGVYVFWAALCFLAVSSTSRFQIGVRHILPVYPLLIAGAAPLVAPAFVGKGRWKWGVVLMCAWYAAGTVAVSPHYLAYFNETAGGASGGYRYLVDSNLDWGQGLQELGRYLEKKKAGTIYLSYFGAADPAHYGIRYKPLLTVTNVACLADPRVATEGELPSLLAVSATNLQGTYYPRHDLFGWLKARKPVHVAAYSIFVYDISHDVESRKRVADLLLATGDRQGYEAEVGKLGADPEHSRESR